MLFSRKTPSNFRPKMYRLVNFNISSSSYEQNFPKANYFRVYIFWSLNDMQGENLPRDLPRQTLVQMAG